MYNLKNILKTEPAVISDLVRAALLFLVVRNYIKWEEDSVGALLLVVSLLLNIFYVRPSTVSKEGLNQLAHGRPLQANRERGALYDPLGVLILIVLLLILVLR